MRTLILTSLFVCRLWAQDAPIPAENAVATSHESVTHECQIHEHQALELLTLEVEAPDHVFRFLPRLKVPGERSLVLALRGGSAKGLAHAGVLRRLDEKGWAVSGIVGTSAGSLAAAMYASGFGGIGTEALFQIVDYSRIIDDRRRTPGLCLSEDEAVHGSLMGVTLSGGRVVLVPGEERARRLRVTLLQSLARGQVFSRDDFNRLGTPFRAVTSSLTRGEARILAGGDLINAVQASMSIPGLLSPIHIAGEQLVDGGLVENLPTMAARRAFPGAMVAGVHIGRPWDDTQASDLFSLLNKSLDVAMRITESRSEEATDLMIRPRTEHVPEFDYKGMEGELYKAGANALDAVEKELEILLLPPRSQDIAASAIECADIPKETLDALIRKSQPDGYTRADFWRLLRKIYRQLPTQSAEIILPATTRGLAQLKWTPCETIRDIQLELPKHWIEEARLELQKGLKAVGLWPGKPFHPSAFGFLEQRLLAAGVERGVSVMDLKGSGFENGILRLKVEEPMIARLDISGKKATLIRGMLSHIEGDIIRAPQLEHALGRVRDRLGLKHLDARLEKEEAGLVLKLKPQEGKPSVLNLTLAFESDWGPHAGLMLAGRNLMNSGIATQLEGEVDDLQKRASLHLGWVPRSFPSLQFGAFGSWTRQIIQGKPLPGLAPEGERRLVRREAGAEAVIRLGWEDRGRIGIAGLIQEGRYGSSQDLADTGRAQVARIYAEWDDLDFHTLPEKGSSLRLSFDRSLKSHRAIPSYWRAYTRLSHIQPLFKGWGLTTELESGLAHGASQDRWWVYGGSASMLGTPSAAFLIPNFVTLRLGLPYTKASLFGSGWQIGPRLDMGRAGSNPQALSQDPVHIHGFGLLARSILRDFYLELGIGRVQIRHGHHSQKETRASFLIGARPFDPWKRK